MRLTTRRLLLRDLKRGDEKAIQKNVNNINVSRYLLVVPYPYTMKDAKEFVHHCLEEQKKKQRISYEFGIELKSSRELIGIISLSKIDHFVGKGMIGYWLGENYWRHGIMNETLIKIIDLTFNKLKLRRIDISACAPNKASNTLIRKIGFHYEGTRRRRVRAKSTGRIYDEKIYGMLREEWSQFRKKRL